MTEDLSELTINELSDAYNRIDKIAKPQEALALYDEIKRRKSLGEKIVKIDDPFEKYHTFLRRFFASFIDGLIFLPIGIIDHIMWQNPNSLSVLIIWYLFYRTSFIAYSVVSHGIFGKTIGKKICKVTVLDVSERKLPFIKAVLRDLFPIIVLFLSLPFELVSVWEGVNPFTKQEYSILDWIAMSSFYIWFVVEIVTMLSNKKRRALHDYIAGSVVIKDS